MISITAITFAINIATSILKRWIYPKFGKLGVQVTAFILAVVGALYMTYGGEFPGLEEIVLSALALFSMTVAMYEVVFQNLSWFKVNTPEVEQARGIEKKFTLR